MNQSYLIQTRRELLAFARLLASYGCAGDGDTPCGKCGPCEASDWLTSRGLREPKPLPPLNEREAEILREMPHGDGCDDWLRPMDCGGRDGSDHSRVLMRLVAKGYVEMKEWGGHCRGSWRYRRRSI